MISRKRVRRWFAIFLGWVSRPFKRVIFESQYGLFTTLPRVALFRQVFYRPTIILGRFVLWGFHPLRIPREAVERSKRATGINALPGINNGVPISFLTSSTVPDIRWNATDETIDLDSFRQATEVNLVLVGDATKPIRLIDSPRKANYFHFLAEVVPQIYKGLGEFQVAVSILHSRQIELLRDFGLIPRPTKSGDTSVSVVRRDLRGGVYPVGGDVLRMRKEILALLQSNQDGPTGHPRIFIRRTAATSGGTRLVARETEEMICGEFGFVPFDPGAHPPVHQFGVFAQAQIVVGPHGAGLTNILACQPGTRLIELNFFNDVRWHYYRMAGLLDMDYALLLSSSSSSGRLSFGHDDFSAVLERDSAWRPGYQRTK